MTEKEPLKPCRDCMPCPDCNGQGWYAEQVSDTEQEQRQCETCEYTGRVCPADGEANEAPSPKMELDWKQIWYEFDMWYDEEEKSNRPLRWKFQQQKIQEIFSNFARPREVSEEEIEKVINYHDNGDPLSEKRIKDMVKAIKNLLNPSEKDKQ